MGLPTEVSKWLQAAGEIDDLVQLIEHAKLLMTTDAKENDAKEKPEGKSIAAVQQPIDQVEALTKQVVAALHNEKCAALCIHLICTICMCMRLLQ